MSVVSTDECGEYINDGPPRGDSINDADISEHRDPEPSFRYNELTNYFGTDVRLVNFDAVYGRPPPYFQGETSSGARSQCSEPVLGVRGGHRNSLTLLWYDSHSIGEDMLWCLTPMFPSGYFLRETLFLAAY